MEAVLRDFDDKNPQEDPVIHFYELYPEGSTTQRRDSAGCVLHATASGVIHRQKAGRDSAQGFWFAGRTGGHHDVGEMAKRHSGLTVAQEISATCLFVQILESGPLFLSKPSI